VIELIISVAIITVISLLIVPSFGRSREQRALDTAADEISLLFHQAETKALAVYKSESGIFPGYGVHVEMVSPQTVILFPDVDASKQINPGTEDTDTASVVYNLPDNIRIKDIIKKSGNESCAQLDIVYLRPLPTITAYGTCGIASGDLGPGEYEIILESTERQLSKKVSIWATGVLSMFEQSTAGGSLTGWQCWRKITFNTSAINTDLWYFPALVKLESGGPNLFFDYTKTKPLGADIRFYDADLTSLNYEIETWDDASGNSYIWVKIPQLNANSTSDYIWMYYNNPAAPDGQQPQAVWTNGYAAVWHMNNDPTGPAPQIKDSTGNAHHGTANGSMTLTDLVNGAIGTALDFDGSNDYISVGDAPDLRGNQNLTLSLWFNSDRSSYQKIITKSMSSSSKDWELAVGSDGSVVFEGEVGGSDFNLTSIANVVSANTWAFYTAVLDKANNDLWLYRGSSQVADNTAPVNWSDSTADGVDIGRRQYSGYAGAQYFNGPIDEIRIANTVRSPEWIGAEYLNQNNPFNFITVEAEQGDFCAGLPPPVVTQCSDSTDNDGDSRFDIDDPACHTDRNALNPDSYYPYYNSENDPECSNNTDDDGDSKNDDLDPGCHWDFNVANPNSYDPFDNNEFDVAECSDNIDNDLDGRVDEDDPACHTGRLLVNPYDPTVNDESDTQCSDLINNGDADGLIDAADPACHTGRLLVNPYNPTVNDESDPQCSDSIDNADPEDTLADDNDAGCHSDAVSSNPSSYDPNDTNETNTQCSNGVDDDLDGLIDTADRSCANPADNDEANPQQCSDGFDNDSDGLTDWPADNGCNNATDNEEIKFPECSDGQDNADLEDSFADISDPGCHTDGNASNPVSYNSLDDDENDWLNRKKITFDNSEGEQNFIDIPVLIRLIGGSNSYNIDYTKTQNNGEDIRFFDPDGTPLYYEIERWDESPGATSFIWVKVPQVDALSTTDYIWMYYNNPAAPDGQQPQAVWTNGYAAVWHMNNDPTGPAPQIKDSTGNAHHGTANGSMTLTDLVNGAIGTAVDFDGSLDNDYISVGDAPDLRGNQNITLSLWFNSDLSSYQKIITKSMSSSSKDWELAVDSDGSVVFEGEVGSSNYGLYSDLNVVSANTWAFYTAVLDRTNDTLRLYVDGSEVENDLAFGNNSDSTADGVDIGRRQYSGYAGTQYFNGPIDEIRIANTVRSPEWIGAEYCNQDPYQNCGSVVNITEVPF